MEQQINILGYIGYGILIFLALTWTLGVRVKLGLGLHTIMGALFFMIAAILVGALGINKLHSWWLLPSGYIFTILCAFIMSARIPILFGFIKVLGSVYAGLIRVGIPPERVKAAQAADTMDTLNRLFPEDEDV